MGFICSGFVFCVAVPTLELFQLVVFLIPQRKNNLRRDASSSVNFEKKKKPVKFASLNDRTHLFKVSFLFSSLRLDNHFSYTGHLLFILLQKLARFMLYYKFSECYILNSLGW